MRRRHVLRQDVMRRWEWATPPPPVHREQLSVRPAGDTGFPPLLLVPDAGAGAAAFATVWLPAAAQRGFPASAVSLRGHGGSGGAELRRRTLLRHYVHDVLQAVVAMPARPVLVGHGFGALVVTRVLARYPARAAVLLAPPGRAGAARAAREPALVRWQAAVSRPPDPALGDPPVLVVAERSGSAAAARRTARAYGGVPVWLDRIDPADRRPLHLLLDWVARISGPDAPDAPDAR